MKAKHIPNILSVFRILLAGIFLIFFFCVNRFFSLSFCLLAGVTDVLDGYLARRNGWITPLGKLLDPLADKLMQFCILCSLFTGGLVPLYILLIFCVKESAQAILGFLMLRLRRTAVVSRWYGKCAVTLFYCAVTVTMILAECECGGIEAFPLLSEFLWGITAIAMIMAFVAYIANYARQAGQPVSRSQNCEKD